MQTGTANRVRSKVRRDVKEDKRRGDPCRKRSIDTLATQIVHSSQLVFSRGGIMWSRRTIQAGTLWSSLTIVAVLCPAQVFTANLTGIVADPNQSVMPGVSVRIKNVATNEARQTVTGSEGRYTFSQLLPGTYDVTAEFTGFRSVVQRDIALAANQSAELNFSMQVGDVTQTVEVKENTVA